MSILSKSDLIHIREVWNDNLEEEFVLIREIVDDYPYIAMDTEFPGMVLRPVGNFKSITEYNYQALKANVDLLKLIQLGLTFSDENGNLPTCGTDKYCIWQFNFREFNPEVDVYAHDSIELLSRSGIDFKKNIEKGVSAIHFSELLMSSGVVLNDSIHWVTFHSGYDFGYLLKVLTCQDLPNTQSAFFDLIKIFFPVLYDIKHLMKFSNSLHGGLNKVAELLEVERVGICHQAGSDSLLTCSTFIKLKENYFGGSPEKYAGVLYGLGVENGQNAYWIWKWKLWVMKWNKKERIWLFDTLCQSLSFSCILHLDVVLFYSSHSLSYFIPELHITCQVDYYWKVSLAGKYPHSLKCFLNSFLHMLARSWQQLGQIKDWYSTFL